MIRFDLAPDHSLKPQFDAVERAIIHSSSFPADCHIEIDPKFDTVMCGDTSLFLTQPIRGSEAWVSEIAPLVQHVLVIGQDQVNRINNELPHRVHVIAPWWPGDSHEARNNSPGSRQREIEVACIFDATHRPTRDIMAKIAEGLVGLKIYWGSGDAHAVYLRSRIVLALDWWTAVHAAGCGCAVILIPEHAVPEKIVEEIRFKLRDWATQAKVEWWPVVSSKCADHRAPLFAEIMAEPKIPRVAPAMHYQIAEIRAVLCHALSRPRMSLREWAKITESLAGRLQRIEGEGRESLLFLWRVILGCVLGLRPISDLSTEADRCADRPETADFGRCLQQALRQSQITLFRPPQTQIEQHSELASRIVALSRGIGV